MVCQKCQAELPEASEFCLKCGTKVAAPPAQAQSASRINPIVWVGLGLVIAVAGFFAWNLATKTSSKPTTVSSADKSTVSSPDSPKVASASAAPMAPIRPMSPQEIFQKVGSGVSLIEVFDDEGHKRGQGSGFVVADDGTAVTNYHVIRGATRATARVGDTSAEVDGVIAFDVHHDVAVVRLSPPPKTVLQLGDSDALKVGQKLVTIGSPLGLQNTISEGIVSGLRNGVIQMSDPISPGSSGGAVFDRYGNVVGISVATVATGQNLNFAVPINWAKPYLKGGTLRQLAAVTAENTVMNDVLDGSVTVAAQKAQSWNFTVNPNMMSNVEILGDITSTGGMGGKITLALYMQGQPNPLYSCRETACSIHQKLAAPGTYVLALDNRESPMFPRTVNGKLSMRYVK
jgi:S1-C subfamily serine protease